MPKTKLTLKSFGIPDNAISVIWGYNLGIFRACKALGVPGEDRLRDLFTTFGMGEVGSDKIDVGPFTSVENITKLRILAWVLGGGKYHTCDYWKYLREVIYDRDEAYRKLVVGIGRLIKHVEFDTTIGNRFLPLGQWTLEDMFFGRCVKLGTLARYTAMWLEHRHFNKYWDAALGTNFVLVEMSIPGLIRSPDVIPCILDGYRMVLSTYSPEALREGFSQDFKAISKDVSLDLPMNTVYTRKIISYF